MAMASLQIHPELQSLIPPLSAEELAQLERNLREEGCHDALVIWQERDILLDGHNRYTLCQQHAIPFATRPISLADLDAAKAWMLQHQLGRRNLTPEQMSYLRGKEYELAKNGHGGDRKSSKSSPQNEDLKVSQQLADKHKVARATIERDATFAKAVDHVATAAGPEARHTLLARDTKLGRQEVKTLATIAKANPQTARHVVEQLRTTERPKEAKQIVRDAAKQLPPLQPVERHPAPQPPPSLVLQIQDMQPKRGLETISSSDGRDLFVLHNPDSKPVFNKTNEMVDWAAWTWNPVTGCWHGCDYCYAREIANDERMAQAYPKKFEPTFHPARLDAPRNTSVPKELTRPADKNVFTCSMADLFGKWVPDSWIMEVFDRVKAHPEWNFLFLTKFPQRLQTICDVLDGFPVNAWVGCTVDAQARVATAERAFRNIQATVRWLSVEPLRERLTFQHLDMFDWMVLGGQTASYYNKTPAFQPPWEWVEHLWHQARSANVKIYWKENLTVRPKETPWEASS
jgi:protein gp37